LKFKLKNLGLTQESFEHVNEPLFVVDVKSPTDIADDGKREPAVRALSSTTAIAERSRAAEHMVIEYEKKLGRNVKSVSLGYDIESVNKIDPLDVRYFEVKSRLGSFSVTLTTNEKRIVELKGDLYYLYYIVTGLRTISITQGPIKPEMQQKAFIDYEIQDWQEHAINEINS
jgi:Domain of unknown function (DUF3883)